MKNDSPEPSPRASWLFGLLFVAVGVLPMLAAFDIGPLRASEVNGPPWLAFAAGGTFVAGGFAIVTARRDPLASRVFAVLSLAGLAALGNWIAFGLGERHCSGSVSSS